MKGFCSVLVDQSNDINRLSYFLDVGMLSSDIANLATLLVLTEAWFANLDVA